MKELATAKRDTGLYEETVFIASWFTRGAYVLKDEDDPGLEGSSIVNIDIDKEVIYDNRKDSAEAVPG